jgi:hypothetical protein
LSAASFRLIVPFPAFASCRLEMYARIAGVVMDGPPSSEVRSQMENTRLYPIQIALAGDPVIVLQVVRQLLKANLVGSGHGGPPGSNIPLAPFQDCPRCGSLFGSRALADRSTVPVIRDPPAIAPLLLVEHPHQFSPAFRCALLAPRKVRLKNVYDKLVETHPLSRSSRFSPALPHQLGVQRFRHAQHQTPQPLHAVTPLMTLDILSVSPSA